MSVLEVGYGAADMTLQMARLVGPNGSVIGVDMDADLLSLAEQRAERAGLDTPVFREGVPKTVVSFAAADCIPCPFKEQCTSAKQNRRRLSLQPRELAEAVRDARRPRPRVAGSR
ncbi:hypothetical protein GCM10010121_097730 [Streptomyces brasiliensis]|uniref:Methyltransferase domain-containing protein n=2 Tax=Streptomyces brasiliensis TaxID=1954 RepID=A0A917PD41_9ACTN|nr:hypothetical protein GCM10010121_097730 [Streptomyces brasiliensis]